MHLGAFIYAGILDNCSHNMEPQLRKLGLPVVLEKGTLMLYVVCSNIFMSINISGRTSNVGMGVS